MSAYVYQWNKRYFQEEVGHLSLELADGTYISHWPGQRKKKFGTVRNRCHSYEDDVEVEGRRPDNTLRLPARMLDQDDIAEWWEEYEGDYNMLKNNCAKVVYKALVAGGIKEYARFHTSLMTESVVVTPADVYEFARQCKNCYEKGPFVGTVTNLAFPFAWAWWK